MQTNKSIRWFMIRAVGLVTAALLSCAVPVDEDIHYSELESVWQHLQAYSIYQWDDSTWLPENYLSFPNPSALMEAIPDTLHGDHFTVYNAFFSVGYLTTAGSASGYPVSSTVMLDTLTDSTVLITISEFAYESTDYAGTANEFMTLIEDIDSFPNIVIDVRQNRGGYIDQVQQIIDAFLPKGVQYIKARERQYNAATRTSKTVEHFWETAKHSHSALGGKKIAILMDDYSASASEILIVALKERANATLLGDTSYGKGIGQIEIPRRERPGMKITYLQLSGVSKIGTYHHTGIAPDLYLGGDTNNDRRALLAAVRVNEPGANILLNTSSLPKRAVAPAQVVEKRFTESLP